MQEYSATAKGPLVADGFIDPNDTTVIQVLWGAPLYQNSTVYRQGDLVRPTTDNGYLYQCSVNGVSPASEPSKWNQESPTKVGTVTFMPVPYNLWVLPSEAISASTWAATNGVQLIYSYFDDMVSSVTVYYVPPGITDFELTNQVVKAPNGESLCRTFRYKVRNQ